MSDSKKPDALPSVEPVPTKGERPITRHPRETTADYSDPIERGPDLDRETRVQTDLQI